jgi:hypothetical protein
MFCLSDVSYELAAPRLRRHVSYKFQGKLQGDVSQQVTLCLPLTHKSTWSHKPQNPKPKNISLTYALSFIRYQLPAWVSCNKYQRNFFLFFGIFFLLFGSSTALQTHSSSIGNILISHKPQFLQARILIVTRCTLSCGLMKCLYDETWNVSKK